MNQCVALIIGAKIQNGYKILSIDTYYKEKLAYPHFNRLNISANMLFFS